MTAASKKLRLGWVLLAALACFPACNPGGSDSSTVSQVHGPGAGGGEGYGGVERERKVTRDETDLALDQLGAARSRLVRKIGLDLVHRTGSMAFDLDSNVKSTLDALDSRKRRFSAVVFTHEKIQAALARLFSDPSELKKKFKPVPGPLYANGDRVPMRWDKSNQRIEVDQTQIYSLFTTMPLAALRQYMAMLAGHELFHLADVEATEVEGEAIAGHLEDEGAIAGFSRRSDLLTTMGAEWAILIEGTRDGWRHDPVAALVLDGKVTLLDEQPRKMAVCATGFGSTFPAVSILGYGMNGPLRIAVDMGSGGAVAIYEYRNGNCVPAPGGLSEIIPYTSYWRGEIRLSSFGFFDGAPVLATAAGPQPDSSAHVRLWVEGNGSWAQRSNEFISSFVAHPELEIGTQVALDMPIDGPVIAATDPGPLDSSQEHILVWRGTTSLSFDAFGAGAKSKVAWVNGKLVVTPILGGGRHFRTFYPNGTLFSERHLGAGSAGVHPVTTASAGTTPQALLLEDRNPGKPTCYWNPLTWELGRCLQ